jgi:putative membrane protein
MLRFIAQTVLTILGNAAGLIMAAFILPDFHITGLGFALSVLFFTIAQIILAPFVFKMAIKYVPALRGGIALVTTFVVLFLTSLFTDGLHINGIVTWCVAPLVVWLCTVIAGILLPLVLFKKVLAKAKDSRTINIG